MHKKKWELRPQPATQYFANHNFYSAIRLLEPFSMLSGGSRRLNYFPNPNSLFMVFELKHEC